MRSYSFPCFVIVVLAASVLAITGNALATTVHVPADQPTIQAGLNAVGSGDTVIVAPGTYAGPGNRDLDFAGNAIRLFSSGGAAVTIIDCGGAPGDPHRGILFDDNELGAFVDGFRFINGYAPAYGPLSAEDGGAILMDGGGLVVSALFRNCEFFRNTAGSSGGAIAAHNSSQINLIKCTLAGNTAASGGGLSAFNASQVHLTEVVLSGNLASGGGGMFVQGTTVTGNLTTISGNHATNIGGGIFGQANANVQMNNIILWGNCADVAGREIYKQISGSSQFTCSDIDTFGVITAGSSTVSYGNDVIRQEPLFCGAVSCTQAPTEAGWYALAAASPCLAANNSCGQDMGRYVFGCGSLATPGDEAVRGAGPRLLALPNPARGHVRITAAAGAIGEPGTLSVYSVSGRLIRTLPVGRGDTALDWDGRARNGERVAAGLYLLRLKTGQETILGRVTLNP